jgi:hypothetical protein
MATIREKVLVEYLADTKPYQKGVSDATKDTQDLGEAAAQAGADLDTMNDSAGESVIDFNSLTSVLKTSNEGVVDSATGVTGLGQALTKMATDAATATRGVTAFSSAMIATGVGAVITGIALLVTYWEDIAIFIGLANEEIEKFDKNTSQLIRSLETELEISELLNLSLEERQAIQQKILET